MRKDPRGRKRKGDFTYKPYDPEFHPQNLLELMSIGLLNEEIYDEWNISQKTFNNWVHKYPELEEAYEAGKPKFTTFWKKEYLEPLMKGKLEGKHSFNAVKYVLDNKSGFAKPPVAQNETNINIAISSDNTTAQLLEKLQENFKFLSSKNIIDTEYKLLPNDSKSDEQDT